jgi:general stress protein 26
MDCKELAKNAAEVIKACGVGVLTTTDPQGYTQSRVMANLGIDDDMTTYFATARDTAKCAHIAGNPKVSVFWFMPESWRQAHLKGEAIVTDEKSLRQRFWNDEYQKYFPGGVDDPTFVLRVIKPKKLTYAANMEAAPECVDF